MSTPNLIEPSGQPERDIHQALAEALPFTMPQHAAIEEMSAEEIWEYSGPIPEEDQSKYRANDQKIRDIYTATLEALDTTMTDAHSLSKRIQELAAEETSNFREQVNEYVEAVKLSAWQQIEGIQARADELILRATTEGTVSLETVNDMLKKAQALDATNERTEANLRRCTEAGLKEQIKFEIERDELIQAIATLNETQDNSQQTMTTQQELWKRYSNAVNGNIAANGQLSAEKTKLDADEYTERREICKDRLAIIGSPEVTADTPEPVRTKVNEILYDPNVKSDNLIIILRNKATNERSQDANNGALKNNTAVAARLEVDIKNTKESLKATLAQIDAARRNLTLLVANHTANQEAYAAEWHKNVSDFQAYNKGDTTAKPANALLQPVFRDKTALQRAEALGSAIERTLQFEEPVFEDGVLTPLLRGADAPESVVDMASEYIEGAEAAIQNTVDHASETLEPIRSINSASRFVIDLVSGSLSNSRGIINAKIKTVYHKKDQVTPEEA